MSATNTNAGAAVSATDTIADAAVSVAASSLYPVAGTFTSLCGVLGALERSLSTFATFKECVLRLLLHIFEMGVGV